MAAPFKKASTNEVHEVSNLLWRVSYEVDNFCHIAHLLPQKFREDLQKLKEQAETELNKRLHQ